MASDDEYSSSLIASIDQGTGSTRCLIFSSRSAQLIVSHQIELQQHTPHPDWLEIDADEILRTTYDCIGKACEKLTELKFDVKNVKALGITNQRETTIVWDKRNGRPLHRAIIWCDGRTGDLVNRYINKYGSKAAFHKRSGLVISPYFSALKLRWLLDNIKQVREAAKENYLMAGTVDTWLIWNLTGGPKGGQFVTDVTNASRTLLMNISSLQWDPKLLTAFDIDSSILPSIKTSSEIYGHIREGPLEGVPISGCLGDQQAALVGEACFKEGMCKNTYGTGAFLLINTGQRPVFSKYGLLTTVGYKFGPDQPTVYALEGSVAVAGQCVRWLRDNLGIIKTSKEVEELAHSVDSTDNVFFVPAFTGLFAPYWHPQARALIIGMSFYTTKAHICRAALEAVSYQTREILEAVCKDCAIPLNKIVLLVDGGMTRNDLFMQIQADVLGARVIRPQLVETSSLGAAIAAGLAKGVELFDIERIVANPPAFQDFKPQSNPTDRDVRYAKWKQAVKRSMNWAGDSDFPEFSTWLAVKPVVLPWAMFFGGILAAILFHKLFISGK